MREVVQFLQNRVGPSGVSHTHVQVRQTEFPGYVMILKMGVHNGVQILCYVQTLVEIPILIDISVQKSGGKLSRWIKHWKENVWNRKKKF